MAAHTACLQPDLQRSHDMPSGVHRANCGAAEHAHALRLHAVVRELGAKVSGQGGGLRLAKRGQRRVVGAPANALRHVQVHLALRPVGQPKLREWRPSHAGGLPQQAWRAFERHGQTEARRRRLQSIRGELHS